MAKPEIGYNSNPRQVAVGDFNRDGYQDIVVANSGADTIGMFLGYGNHTFASQVTYPMGLGSHPYAVAVGHFNNDTLLDVVVAHFGTNSIGVYLGDGNGSFSSQIITSLNSSRPLSLVVGDFNNDDQSDIAVVNYGTSEIAVLLGSNDGSFRVEAIYDMGYDSTPYSLAVADFNDDNKLDIVVVNYGTSNVAILLNNMNETFTTHMYSTGNGSRPCSVAINDFNNDKILDIAVANSNTGNVGIYLGYKNGSFTNMMIYSTGSNSQPQFIVTTDIDNDTKVDIITIDSVNNTALVLKGDGNGNFSITRTRSTGYNSNPSSIAIGDFDNDNKPDIAITNSGANNILVFSTYTSNIRTNQTLYSTGTDSSPNSVVVSDFNNDSLPDIVVPNMNDDNVGIFINLDNGVFEDQMIYPTGKGSKPSSVAVSDVNNDNQLDIIIVLSGISEIQILFGMGNGSFNYGNSLSTGQGSTPETIAVGYFNDDNNIDIVFTDTQTLTVGVLLGYEDGTFTNVTTYLNQMEFSVTAVFVNDINNDNRTDIIVCDADNGGIAILLGYGNGSFASPLLVPTKDENPIFLAFGDLNNDHRLDIVYVSPLQGNVGILLGYGNGTFGNIIKYFIEQGAWPFSVTLGDLNNDTFLDIGVTHTFTSNLGVFFGFGNGSFAPENIFSVGTNSFPTSIVFSDLNNDNQMDITVSSQFASNIGVFLVYYEMDFAYQTSYSTGSGSHPISVAIGVFNKDNQSDIVVANSGNDNIQLLLGYSQGVFISEDTYSTGFGSYPQVVAVADLNRDKQLDIVVGSNTNGTIAVFSGYGNGTFASPTIHWTGSNSFPSSIAVGDFNKDNWMDIVVANSDANNISVLFGFNYSVFTNETIHLSTRSSLLYYVAAGDFNNDHQWDIALADFGGRSLDVYLGYGNGTFSEQISTSTDSSTDQFFPSSVAAGDFNGDNQLDLVATFNSENSIGICLGYGNGSFQTQIRYDTGDASNPSSVAVGDFNKDNILDIVVANQDSNNIGVFIGYGNGTFRIQTSYLTPNDSSPNQVVVVDLNNDSILDIVVPNYGGDCIGLFFGYGNGSFGNMITLFTGDSSGPYSVATKDINNDAWIDIVVVNRNANEVGIFFGHGNGSFASQTTFSTGSQSDLFAITLDDLNNDAKLDIIVSNWGSGIGSIDVYYGYGDGNFTVLKTYPTGLRLNPSLVAICDFNNDNRTDLAVAFISKAIVGVMLQYKTEPFATPVIFSTGTSSHPKSVAVGDFNNDGYPDISVANSGTNTVGIFLGKGNRKFVRQQIYSTGNSSQPVSIGVGDFNNDAHLDVVVANSQANTLVIFRGFGNGTIGLVTTYSTGIGSSPSSVAVKDVNQDQQLDIVVTNIGSDDVIVFLGSGNWTFTELKPYSLGYNTRPVSVAIGDINNDSLFDIVVANYAADYVEILLQTC